LAKGLINQIANQNKKMKTKFLHRLIHLGLFALLILPFLALQAEAQAPIEYGREFGLFVHQQNQDLAVPRVKGQQVLESFFSNVPLKPSYDEAKQFMTQRDFLLGFERLRLEEEGEKTKLSDKALYPMVWLRARRNNWLPNANLTYKSMRDFLYRYAVSKKHGDASYYEGLVLDEEEINPQNFSSINQVRGIGEELDEHFAELKKLRNPTKRQKTLMASLDKYSEAFSALEDELRILNHPLNKLRDLPGDIREKIIANDLNEVLDEITYNYSHNNANRIHNLVTGAMQLNGRVFKPEEVINLEQELGRGGWWKYKFGWVIFGGTEEWQFGGGQKDHLPWMPLFIVVQRI
jgi:hypothetical protein